MSLFTLCEIVFFLGFGINHFYSHRILGMVVAVAAIAIGVILLIGDAGSFKLN